MSETTSTPTLFSQSMFDSLFVALKRDSDDSRIKDICKALSERGYTTPALVKQVQRAVGSTAAERVRRACLGGAPSTTVQASMSSTQRFRMSRRRRIQRRFEDLRDSFEDGVGDILFRLRQLTGRDRH